MAAKPQRSRRERRERRQHARVIARRKSRAPNVSVTPITTARVLVRTEVASDGKQRWLAQILDFDLATQTKSLDDLPYAIEHLLMSHLVCCEEEGLVPFECLPPAPGPLWDEYKRGVGLALDIVRVARQRPKPTPPVEKTNESEPAAPPVFIPPPVVPSLEFRLVA